METLMEIFRLLLGVAGLGAYVCGMVVLAGWFQRAVLTEEGVEQSPFSGELLV